MVLSDKEIHNALKTDKLVIRPEPKLSNKKVWGKVVLEGHLSTNDADFFRLARDISSIDLREWGSDEKAKLRFYESSKEILTLSRDKQGKYYSLHPHEFVLVYTNERFSIRHDAKLMALVQGKSGLARLGLSVHVTAPIIHPGFGEKGKPEPIMLEIFNHGHLTIKIFPGMPVCQYVFEQVFGSYINTSITGFAAGQPRKKAA